MEKLADYARVGIPYYCGLADPQLRTLKVYEQSRPPLRWGAQRRPGPCVCSGLPGLALDLGALWDEIDEAEHIRTRRQR